ncbi:MAG: winged helix-turn-helix transcriptional regulator [Mangrovibacterium sp.]
MREKKIINFERNGFCPVRDVLSRLGDKWSVLIIATLQANGVMRFGEIQQSIGDISQRMLTLALRSLEADGIVHREIYPEVPPRVEYQLTDMGLSLFSHLHALIVWASENGNEILRNRERTN